MGGTEVEALGGDTPGTTADSTGETGGQGKGLKGNASGPKTWRATTGVRHDS